MHTICSNLLKLMLVVSCLLIGNSYAAHNPNELPKAIVDAAIRPLMQNYHIPGIAVAVTINGQHNFYNYGYASKATHQPITDKTLFEIGSLTKTFTATLASYAQVAGKLALADSVSKFLPELLGSSFDKIKLLNLATHTSGGLPLQVPDTIKNNDQLMTYLKQWKPAYVAGTHRTYSNPSIGMLGLIAANSMHEPFEQAVESKIFSMLGMTNSYFNIPDNKVKNYAQGYTAGDAPIRLKPGVLASQAYGIKSCAADLLQFIDANMQLIKLNSQWQHAIANTHRGYFKSGQIIQDLIWEQYPYPLKLKQLLAGNSDQMIHETMPATQLNPPLPPKQNVLINKTGSTNGFASYAAFIPARKIGIIILANKNYPIAARVTAAYQILTQIDKHGDK